MQDFKHYLQQQAEQGLYRRRQALQSPQQVCVRLNDAEYLNFCSNDYLGLANHPVLIEAFKRAADQFGVGSGASQLICGYQQPHYELEQALADFLGRERVLLFATGYMANLGVVSALAERKDRIIEDRLNHASLIDAATLARAQLQRYRHVDSAHLQEILQSDTADALIISDGVFSMDGDVAPVAELADIAQANRALLMIDDAHGIGVLGEAGRGSVAGAGFSTSAVPILTAE